MVLKSGCIIDIELIRGNIWDNAESLTRDIIVSFFVELPPIMTNYTGLSLPVKLNNNKSE